VNALILEKTGAKVSGRPHLLQVIDRIVSAWAAEWTNPRPWSMPGFRTGPSETHHSTPGLDGPCMSIRRSEAGPSRPTLW